MREYPNNCSFHDGHGDDSFDPAVTSDARLSSDVVSPEVLVRQESRILHHLRVFAVLILLSTAIIMSASIFAFIRKSEQKNLETEFRLIAESISAGLLEDSGRYVSFGETIVATIEMAMAITEQNHTSFNIPRLHYTNVVRQSIIATRSHYVSWNPLLRSDEERREFEAMVAEKEIKGFFESTGEPSCYLCGSEGVAPTNPNVQLETGAGKFTCEQLDEAGRLGMIPTAFCPTLEEYFYEVCGCDVSVPNDEESLSSGSLPRRKPSDGIFRYAEGTNNDYEMIDEPWNGGPYLPMWEDRSAFEGKEVLLYNHLSHPKLARAASKMIFRGEWQMTEFVLDSDVMYYRRHTGNVSGPFSVWYFPVRDPVASEVVGAISFLVDWNLFSLRKPPRNGELVEVLVESSCGDQNSKIQKYRLQESGGLLWVGGSDSEHDSANSRLTHQTSFEDFDVLRQAGTNSAAVLDNCSYRFSVYSTAELHGQYLTSQPWLYAGVVIIIFLVTSGVFAVYDSLVRRRQNKIMKSAKQTDDIVTSLFPHNVRGRLFQHDQETSALVGTNLRSDTDYSNKVLGHVSRRPLYGGTSPIADLFPSCTVIFIDISNFTPWSSEREPSQVFALLEALYHAFDVIAEQLGVFKVETIGDSYVAVAGLPKPRSDHAAVMATFGHQCLLKMRELVNQLEETLGPSTGDLRANRFHSRGGASKRAPHQVERANLVRFTGNSGPVSRRC
jgi:Adenylate and Guanylate cyclase catalytic domain